MRADDAAGVRCEVGLFAVEKKSGKQRLVIDCRLANCWFSPPAAVKLPTASAYCRGELQPEETCLLRHL